MLNELLKKEDLRTHMTVLGRTGSGKSGLLLGLTEDLYKQEVPVVLVDLKGDMVNIALTDNLEASFRCITPGAHHGESINIFSELNNPHNITQAVSMLLQLAGESVDPLRSSAHTFVSTLLEHFHGVGDECNLENVVQGVLEPPFVYLGAMDLDQAFTNKQRAKLASKLNNLLAAPSFQPWREGTSLNMDSLFNTEETPVVIYSVAHLPNFDEQLFALSLFFNEFLHWTKRQSGTDELRAALIVDECVGLLPPHPKNPPTKNPLLLLLKQARAFGVGCVLASQNPVDLDYKALSNCSTWMIGKLSMEKDRERVVKGVCGSMDVEQKDLHEKISALQSREFVVVHPQGLDVVETQDVDCLMQGPMVPEEIERLYEKGLLNTQNVVQDLHTQLYNAKDEVSETPSIENIKRIADLEKKIDRFGFVNAPHYMEVPGVY